MEGQLPIVIYPKRNIQVSIGDIVEYDSSIRQSIQPLSAILDRLERTILSLFTSIEQIFVDVVGVDEKWYELTLTHWIVVVVQGHIGNKRYGFVIDDRAQNGCTVWGGLTNRAIVASQHVRLRASVSTLHKVPLQRSIS